MARLWLILPALGSCVWGIDPDAVKPLSALPEPTLHVSANLRSVSVTIVLDARAAGACPILDDKFQATLDAVALEITERGASRGSNPVGERCAWPSLELDNPPASVHAAIVLSYPGHSIRVDLLDLLAPRSAQLVPDGPWAFTPGQTITLRWSPIEDFATYQPSLVFVTDDVPQIGVIDIALPREIVDDRMTFALPIPHAEGSLEVSLIRKMLNDSHTLPCSGATCWLIETPRFMQHITWLPTSPAR
jgi:hypothetical protein